LTPVADVACVPMTEESRLKYFPEPAPAVLTSFEAACCEFSKIIKNMPNGSPDLSLAISKDSPRISKENQKMKKHISVYTSEQTIKNDGSNENVVTRFDENSQREVSTSPPTGFISTLE